MPLHYALVCATRTCTWPSFLPFVNYTAEIPLNPTHHIHEVATMSTILALFTLGYAQIEPVL